MPPMYLSNYDHDEELWHLGQRAVKLPGQLLPLDYTQSRVDSNTNREYCNNCQLVGNFISTRPLINRIPDGHTSSKAEASMRGKPYHEMKHDIISLGNLADLQANQGCICCQSVVSTLGGRVITQDELHQWDVEVCWNGAAFHCILLCRENNHTKALQLRRSKLQSEPEGMDPSSFPYGRYSRLMDVYKIDTTMIQEWIESCDRLHGPESQKIAPLLPASKLSWLYLIDLETQCLVKVDTAESPRYIALSYVWGGVEMLKTTTENLEEMLQPGALFDSQGMEGPKLAQTIVDAMDLARKLGCPFFWTDCICIVQDDEVERTIFLNEMASIYSNAYLTIVAAAGAEGNYGIPGIGRCSEPRDILWSELRFPGHTLSFGPDCELTPALYGKEKSWSTRGWTFQESYLSRRLLVFTSIVSFHCQEHISCEWDFTPHGTRNREVDRLVDRTSFICDVPNWPNIDHYSDVVSEYSQKNLSFDDDILYAFAGVVTVLRQSFHSGFHYGLPEVFFDASLLWEPDWHNPTPPQLRKTQKLLLPSWSWVRRRGSIKTDVWRLFAQDFYKDTSFENIYELKPRVQWRKICSQGGAFKPIKYQHFNNHVSMPPGWITPKYGYNDRYNIRYSHTLSPATEYLHPFPFPETAEAHLPDIEIDPLLRCIAKRGWLIKSDELENFQLSKLYGAFNLCLGDGTWAGILFDDRVDQSFPQESDERCEVIAIAEGRVPGMRHDLILPERAKLQRTIFPGERAWNHRDFCYEFYFILWIGWVDGIAYRRGIGRVFKGVWENMELEEVEVLLG